MPSIDDRIKESLEILREEKYKLRVYQLIIKLDIDASFGVDESLQALRAIEGITVVTALDSIYQDLGKKYRSRVKIKFHPQRDTMTPVKYINHILLPAIRGRSIPGVDYISREEPFRIG